MSDSQKITPSPDGLDDPRLTALALGELGSAELAALDDEARREVDEIARFADSLGAALRTDEAGLDAGRRAAILAASLGAARTAPVLPLPARRLSPRALRRVVQWSAGGAVAAGLALTALPNLLEARKHDNEAAAIGALKSTNRAETHFREGDKEGNGTLDYGNIAALSATTLVDGVLGEGRKQGHTFQLEPSTKSGELLVFGNANPGSPTATGDRYFCSNHSGVIYYTERSSVPLDTSGTAIPTHVLPVGKGEENAPPDRSTLYGSSMFGGRTEDVLSREEVERLRERSVRDLNGKQREIDDLRREKNDLQGGNIYGIPADGRSKEHRKRTLTLHDATDLVTLPPDFPAPELGLSPGSGGGGGGGTLSFDESIRLGAGSVLFPDAERWGRLRTRSLGIGEDPANRTRIGDYELSSGGTGVVVTDTPIVGGQPQITDYDLSSSGSGRIVIDGKEYVLPTSQPTPTPATTLEGLYTGGWRPTPLIETAKEPQSTFAIDVDTASYARVRASIRVQSRWPAASSVRVEELVNYHEYGYPAPTDGRPIAASTEVTTCPWAPDRRLVRIGLRGRGLEGQQRPKANLVFLIDVSGSMGSVEKLPLVQRSLALLTSQLGAGDRVSIVVYAGASGCVLDGASGGDRPAILAALERLQSGGSTNGGAGIELAYQLASRRFIEGGVNRVVLCTDGDWNVGAQSQQALEELIAQKAKGHVQLTALGFGMTEGGDRTLETLADRGDGNYAYVDGLPEARRVLVEQLDGTLVTIGKDVKVQVEWDPAVVTGYTLVGYEDRRLANADFANDAKDAGDVGARHAVTALYEVTTKPGATNLGTLRLRWKAIKAGLAEGTSELLEVPLTDDGRTLEKTSADTRFAMGVAAFALGLKAGPGPGQQLLEVAQALADGARADDPHGLRAELSELVRTARGLGR